MEARETTFEKLVNGKCQFRVPLYQRPYSWTEADWSALWDAIVEQAEALAAGDTEPGHFLGSVVLAPAPVPPGGPTVWIVVDGQQRLTTLSLALCALRDRIRAEDPERAAYVHEDYLVNRRESGEYRLKLMPTQADRKDYRACIDGSHTAGGAGNIGAAHRFFQAKLEEYDDPDDPHDLSRLEQAITGRLDLVGIAAGPNDNAHRIFESLNNTGRPLTQADLLRNYLFMLLPSRGDQVYERYWLPMQHQLGSEELEELAWLHLVVSGDDRVRRDGVYRAYQKLLRPAAGGRDESAVETFVAELARRAQHLHLILHPEREPDPHVRAGLRRLSEWDASTARPVVMLLLDRRDQGTATSAEIVEAITYLESFLVRRMLTGRDSKNVNRILNAAPARLASGPVAEQLRAYLSQERHFWADDDTLREAIRERNFYWSGRTPQRMFVLRRLEETFGHREPVDWAQAKVSIEHVLPQTMTDEWRAVLAEEIADGRAVDEVHASVVHTLGNLTLTGYNQHLSNRPFTEKRRLLADSGLAMNHAIASSARWGEAQILDRAADLAERAINLWPGPLPAQRRAKVNPKWRLLRQALAVMPAGTWTSYSDLAELIGSHQVPVGQYLATELASHPWRVLTIDGTVSPNFRWQQADRTDDPLDLLRGEGVRIDERERADQAQRLTAAELADLVGLHRDEAAGDEDTAEESFWSQLRTAQPLSVVEATTAIIDHWRAAGGHVGFGSAAEAGCYLFVRPGRSADGRRPPWPWAIYPLSGRIEVVFQHLKVRQPFDDPAMREEFRQICNRIPGVNLPPAKLDVRPSFPLDVLGDDRARATAQAALDWFMTAAR